MRIEKRHRSQEGKIIEKPGGSQAKDTIKSEAAEEIS